MLDYSTTSEFDKDFKRLEKRYRTLQSDFENMKKSLLETHYLKGAPLPINSLVEIKGFCGDNYKSQKIRKFACRALKNLGNCSGIRIIFVFEPKELKITFIEIYFKGDKENEDRERLTRFLLNNNLK